MQSLLHPEMSIHSTEVTMQNAKQDNKLTNSKV